MKKKLLYIFAFLCYYTGVIQLMYWLNRNRKRIITFHNILTDDVFESNVANGVSNSLSQFKIIINEISKHFNFSLDLDNPKSVTITFDDGYCNQFEVAGSYLLSKNIPAYIFICGQLLLKDDKNSETCVIDRVLTVDLLMHWVSYAPTNKYSITINGKVNSFEFNENNRLNVWSNIIWPAFLDDNTTKGVCLMEELNKLYPIKRIIDSLPQEYVKQRLGTPTAKQIETLVNNGWQIAWHTYSHYPLAHLSYNEKLKEITPDYRIKSKIFSYPYGGIAEVDNESLSIVEELGYDTAVSNINTYNMMSSKWFRSRMTLSSNPILIHFELSGLKYLLKYGSLLPKI